MAVDIHKHPLRLTLLLVTSLTTIHVISGLEFQGNPSQFSIWPKWHACVNASISFEFRTRSPRAVLLYTDDGGTYDYFQLLLYQGKVNLTLNIVDGNEGSVQIVNDKPANDGNWHKVTISRNRMETTLKVDLDSKSKVSIGSDFLFGRLPTNSPVYIGGIPRRFQRSLSELSAPSVALVNGYFKGKIRNVLYNNCTCKTVRARVVDHVAVTDDREACNVNDPCDKRGDHNCICLSTDAGSACDCQGLKCQLVAITYYHLPMDSVLGSTVVNPSGLDATVYGSPRQTPGVVGQALVLDAKKGQYVKVSGPGHRYECFGDLDKCPRGYTIMAWLQFLDVGTTKGTYISNGGHSLDGHGIAMKYANGHIEFVFRRSNGEEWNVEYDNVLMNRWYHVTATWKNSEGLILYINGDAVAKDITPSKKPAAPKYVLQNDFIVGWANQRGASHDLGTMMVDELSFWSEARSPSQIRESGPIYRYYLPMDDMSTGQLEVKNMLPRVHGTVDIVPGKVQNALSLNGDESYIDFGSYSHSCLGNLDLCQYGLYMSFWISLTELKDNTYYIATGPKGIVMYYSNKRLYVTATSGDKTWTVFQYGPKAGQWYFVEVSWKKDTSLTLYVDSNRVHTKSEYTMSDKSTSSFTDFYIGRANSDMKLEHYAAALFDNIEIMYADKDTLEALQFISRVKPQKQYFPFEDLTNNRLTHHTYVVRTYNQPTLIPGKIGKAIQLQSQQKQYINIGEHHTQCFGNLDLCPHGVTIAFWLRANSLRNGMTFISTAKNGFILTYDSNSLTAVFKTTTREWKLTTDRFKTPNMWYHLEFSWHPDTGVSMYINGDLAEKSNLYTRRYSDSIDRRSDEFYIGTSGIGGSGTYADAAFDELEYWDAARDHLLAFGLVQRGKPTSYLIDMEVIENQRIKHPTLDIGIVGNPKLVTGKIGNALYLNGNGQYVDMNEHRDECMGNIMKCQHGITITFWIKFHKFDNYMYYLSTGQDGYQMYYQGGYVFVVFGQPGKLWQASLLQSQHFQRNQWYFMEISWHEEHGVSVFVNGKNIATVKTHTPKDIPQGNLNRVYIGRGNPGDTPYGQHAFGNMTIDEMEIWYLRRDELVAFNHVLRDNIGHEVFSMETAQNGKIIHPKYDDITLENGASIVPGRYGNGVYLNGNGQFVSLGDHRHSCIGNLDFCPHGILITMWLHPYDLRDNTYFMSNPSYSLFYKNGQLQSTFHTQTRSWSAATPKFYVNKWQKVDLSWHPQRGLSMYIDDYKLADDTRGITAQNDIQADAPVYLGKALGDMRAEHYGNTNMDELTYKFASKEDLNVRGYNNTIHGWSIYMDAIRNGRLINRYFDSYTFGNPQIIDIAGKRAITLNGRSQYIYLGDNIICGGNLDECERGYTLRMYLRPQTLIDNQQIFGSFPISLYYKNRRLYARVQTPTKTWETSTSGLDPRRWQFVEVTWHPQRGIEIYIDSLRVAHDANYHSTTLRSYSPKTYIGRSVSHLSTDRYMDGTIGLVEFWDARRPYLVNDNHIHYDYRIVEPRGFTYRPQRIIYTRPTRPPPIVYTPRPRPTAPRVRSVYVTPQPRVTPPDVIGGGGGGGGGGGRVTGGGGRVTGGGGLDIHIGATERRQKAFYYDGSTYSIFDIRTLSREFFTPTNTEMVHFWFATRHPHGLLWHSENAERKAYLGFRNGKLLFMVDYKDTKSAVDAYYIFPRNDVLNDGNWHYVQVIRNGDKLNFVVDGRSVGGYTLERRLQFMVGSTVMLGGAANPRDKTNNYVSRNFNGVLSDFTYHRRDQIGNAVQRRDIFFFTLHPGGPDTRVVDPDRFTLPPIPVTPRRTTPPTTTRRTTTTTTTTRKPTPPPTYEISFIHKDAYVTLGAWRITRMASLSFDFRTIDSSGLLLFNGAALGSYIAVEVFDGKLYLVYQLTGSHERRAFLSGRIDDGRYHSVTIRIRNNVLITKLDSVQRSYTLRLQSTRRRTRNAQLETLRSRRETSMMSGPMYVGFVRSLSDIPWYIWSTTGFRGCIRNLQMNLQLQNLHQNLRQNQRVLGIRRGCTSVENHCLRAPCYSGYCDSMWGDFHCDCAATSFTGKKCDHAAKVAVLSGNTTFKIRYDDVMRSHIDDISIRFKTQLPNGLILDTRAKGSKAYLRLLLENGRLKFMTNLGGRVKSVYFGSNLNDDVWHTAYIHRRANHIEVWVDKGDHVKETLYGENYQTHVDTFFIGTPKPTHKYKRYIGYLSNFYFNGIDVFNQHNHRTLTTTTTSKPLPPIIFNPVTFKTRSVFASLPPISAKDTMLISFLIKTIESSGLILYNEGEGDKFIGIELQNGEIQYNYNVGQGTSKLALNNIHINDNRWHEIKIQRLANGEQTIYVDNHKIPSTSGVERWNFKDRLFIGGLPQRKWEDVQRKFSSRQGYQGCFAALNMNGYVPDLYNPGEAVFSTPGDVSPGCLEPKTVCDATMCSHYGTCIQNYVGYICDCNMTSYIGQHCTDYGVAYRFGKTKGGIVIYKFAHGDNPTTSSENLAFGFKTWEENGLIARIDSLIEGQYMEVRLVDGHILVEYRMGTHTMTIKSDKQKYNDGKYHVVRLYRNQHNGTLYVDGYNAVPIIHHGEAGLFTRQGYIYLGGLVGKNNVLTDIFDGIIAGFYYNGKRVLDYRKFGPFTTTVKGDVVYVPPPLPLLRDGSTDAPVVIPPIVITPKVPMTPPPITKLPITLPPATAPPIFVPPVMPVVPAGVGGGGVAIGAGGFIGYPSGNGGGIVIPSGPITGPVVAGAGAPAVVAVSGVGATWSQARAGAVVGAILGVMMLLAGLAWAFIRCKPGCCPCLPCAGGGGKATVPVAVSSPRAASNIGVITASANASANATAGSGGGVSATAASGAGAGGMTANGSLTVADGSAFYGTMQSTGSGGGGQGYDSATLRATGTFSNKGTVIGSPQTQRAATFNRFDASSVTTNRFDSASMGGTTPLNLSPTAPPLSGNSTLNQNFVSSLHQTSGYSGGGGGAAAGGVAGQSVTGGQSLAGHLLTRGGSSQFVSGGSYRDGSMSAGVLGHDARYDTLGGQSGVSGSQTGTLGTSYQYQVHNVRTVTMGRQGGGQSVGYGGSGLVGGASVSGMTTPSALTEEIRADCCVTTSDGLHVVTGSPIGGPQVWNMQTGELVRSMVEDAYGSTNLHLACHDRLLVGSVNADLDVNEFSTRKGIMNRKLQIWDFESGQPLTMGGDEYASALCLMNDDGDKVMFARTNQSGNSTSVVVWDLIGNQMIKEMRYDAPVGNQDYVSFLSLSKNNRYVVAGFNNTLDGQGVFVVFDMTLASYNIVQPNVLSLDADPEVTVMLPKDEAVSGLRNGDLVIWSLRTNQPSRQLISNAGYHAHSREVKSLALSTDNRFLVSASTDSTIKLWDMRNERQAYTLNGHSGEVWCVCISSDNEIIASGSNDGTIRLWRLKNGTQVCMFSAHMDIFNVQISPNKGTIVALGDKYGARKLVMLQVVRQKTSRRFSE